MTSGSQPLQQDPFADVCIRQHSRSRRLKLSFTPERGFLLSHPPRTSRRSIQRFLESQVQWMKDVRNKAGRVKAEKPSLLEYLKQNPVLSLNGVEKTILFANNHSGLVHESASQLSIYSDITEEQLCRHLQALSKKPLEGMLWNLSEYVDHPVKRIQIRNQKTRWGSCSGSGTISLNWRIILMPHSLQRHILLHELAHIPHPNHSSRFWNCLRSWDPDTDLHHAQIRKHGTLWISLGRS